jgi:hypothetical protein
VTQRIVVGFSGGVTSAWCAGWALRSYPREEVVLLFHDTKEEHPDTYRFIKEMAVALDMPVTEQSDGRSVTEVFADNGALANNRMAFCSRILKAEQRDKYFKKLRAEGVTEITNVLGFSKMEWQRVQRTTARALEAGYLIRFPIIEQGISKQQCADWCVSLGVKPSEMYRWSEHANCPGCVRGGKAYWLKVKDAMPEVWEQRVALEREYGHTFLKDTSLVQLSITDLKREVRERESIDIGPCECGS